MRSWEHVSRPVAPNQRHPISIVLYSPDVQQAGARTFLEIVRLSTGADSVVGEGQSCIHLDSSRFGSSLGVSICRRCFSTRLEMDTIISYLVCGVFDFFAGGDRMQCSTSE